MSTLRRAVSTHEKELKLSGEENKENIDANRERNGGKVVESDKENDKFFSDVIDFEMDKNLVEYRNNINYIND
jgi:hypothetical protein